MLNFLHLRAINLVLDLSKYHFFSFSIDANFLSISETSICNRAKVDPLLRNKNSFAHDGFKCSEFINFISKKITWIDISLLAIDKLVLNCWLICYYYVFISIEMSLFSSDKCLRTSKLWIRVEAGYFWEFAWVCEQLNGLNVRWCSLNVSSGR